MEDYYSETPVTTLDNTNHQYIILKKLADIETLIETLIKENQTEDEIFSFNQVCEYLELSKSYLYKLTMLDKVPHYKPLGKKLYFSKKEIDKWITKKPLGNSIDSLDSLIAHN